MRRPDLPATADEAARTRLFTRGKESSANDFRYWAFISYSHHDKAWGAWLHRALEMYRVPKRLVGRTSRDGVVPKRISPIFRDREELSASSDLGSKINDALRVSRYLIVICSPNSAASKWVNEEVRVFKALGREDRILCLIIDGEPNTSDNTASTLRECFPEGVRFRVDVSGVLTAQRSEPLAADARPGMEGKKNARLKLIAGLLGVGFDELKQREHQRQVRILVGVTSALCGIALTMTILAYVAVTQRKVAEANEREAVYQKGVALIEQGHALNMTNRWLSGSAALEAGRSILQRLGKQTLQADLRSLEAELGTLVPYRYLSLREVNGMDTSRDGTLLAVSSSRRICIIDLAFDQPIASFDVNADITLLALAPDGTRVAAALGSELRIYDARSGLLLHTASLAPAVIASAEFVPGAEAIVMAATEGGVHVWNFARSVIEEISERKQIIAVDLSENGRVLAIGRADGVVEACGFSNLRCFDRRRIATGQFKSLALSYEGKWLITADEKNLRLWDARTGSRLRESASSANQVKLVGGVLLCTDIHQNDVSVYDIRNGSSLGSFKTPLGVLGKLRAVWSTRRMALLTTSDDGVLYWQLTFDQAPGSGSSVFLPMDETTNAISLSPNGMLTAIGTSRGSIHIYDTHDLRELLAFKAHEGECRDISFGRRSELLATAGDDGYAVVWALDQQKEVFRNAIRGGKPTAVAIDGDAAILAVGTDAGEVHVMDLATRKPRTEPLRLGKAISSLAFAPFGDELAIASTGADVQVWSSKAGSVRKLAHLDFQGRPRVRMSASGSLLVIADRVFLFASSTDLKCRTFGVGSGTIADAGFLGSELLYQVYAFENRGISILSTATEKEVAYLSPTDTLPFVASASPNGDALAIAGIDGIKTFASGPATERMELRRRMLSTDVTVKEGSKGERAKMLAAWYLAHGSYSQAHRYLDSSNGVEQSLPALAMSRLWRAIGRPDKAIESLQRALERKEITPTYFAVASRAVDTKP